MEQSRGHVSWRQSPERRCAIDGAWYTYTEFRNYYGARTDWYWMEARKDALPHVSNGAHLAGACHPRPPAVSPPRAFESYDVDTIELTKGWGKGRGDDIGKDKDEGKGNKKGKDDDVNESGKGKGKSKDKCGKGKGRGRGKNNWTW